MASGITVEIDGRGFSIPDDLDLNDVVALEEAGWSLDNLGSMSAIRFLVHRLLLRVNPDITLEEAGAKVPLSLFTQAAEGPQEIPLPEPEAQSGTPGGDENVNGSTGTAKVEMHGVTGPR